MAQQADRESRTEEPTEKKILDEFEKGNTPVSREASTFAATIAMLAITAFMARDLLSSVGSTLKRLSSDPGGGGACFLISAARAPHCIRPGPAGLETYIIDQRLASYIQRTRSGGILQRRVQIALHWHCNLDCVPVPAKRFHRYDV